MQVVVALVGMLVVLWLGAAEESRWTGWGWDERAMQLLLWIAAGGASYVLMLWVMGLRPAALRRTT
jgi:putative peptidoglycan lipid II flippase